jgi:hypothetical protein
MQEGANLVLDFFLEVQEIGFSEDCELTSTMGMVS